MQVTFCLFGSFCKAGKALEDVVGEHEVREPQKDVDGVREAAVGIEREPLHF